MTKERRVFNFFADLGEKIEGTENGPSDNIGGVSSLLRWSSNPFTLFLFAAIVLFIGSGIYRTTRDEQKIELARFTEEVKLYSDLTEELNHAVHLSEERQSQIERGRVQSVDFNSRVAVIRAPNDKKFQVNFGPNTEVFIYLPSTRRLVRVSQQGNIVLLRGDRVAVLSDPSGKALAVVFAPRQREAAPG